MSKEALERIFGKAVTDSSFRDELLADPEKAVEGYELTEEEIKAIKEMDKESIQKFVGGLDERISKRGGGCW